MFLNGVPIEDYLDAKAQIDLTAFQPALPSLLVDFYAYVVGLNYKTDINFYQWRTKISQKLGKDSLQGPYQWMLVPKKEVTCMPEKENIPDENWQEGWD